MITAEQHQPRWQPGPAVERRGGMLAFAGMGIVSCLVAAACHGQSSDEQREQALDAPAAQSTAGSRGAYERFALENQGDALRGHQVFTNLQTAACIRCHTTDGSSAKAGPDLSAISDKFSRGDIIRSLLDPSAAIAIGYDTTILETRDGEEQQGVIKQATDAWVELMGWDGTTTRVAVPDIAARRTANASFMPSGMETLMGRRDFADLVAYLQTLHQRLSVADSTSGVFDNILPAANPASLRPFFGPSIHLERPVWFGEVPGGTNRFVVLEHGGRSWLIERTAGGERQSILVDLRGIVREGGATGLLGLAFHPQFATNRRYFLKYQVLENGRIFTLLVERRFAEDLSGDAGVSSRELLRIPSVTQDHNGGCIAFGPDGHLYLGMGDTGPQRDPQGHSQDLKSLLGKILRLDVDHADPMSPYGIPGDNLFQSRPEARPEIWASGFREPWRFSFDIATGDLWVGDVGQDRVEEVAIVRARENHGWNVFEGAAPFSNRYRRETESYVPPVFSYSHRVGVSVTGGHVYRGRQAPQMNGRYICGDFESRRLWAVTQTNRHLTGVVEIGRAPTRVVSFAEEHGGELFLVGYDDGKIYQLDLSGVDPAPLETRTLADTSERAPVRWRYQQQPPPDGWYAPGFDDAVWNYGPGGFGTRGTPGAVVRTEWNTADIWLRREFTLARNLETARTRSVALRVHHDEDVEVYLNGVEAARLQRWTSGYVEVALSPEAVRSLHTGRNVLAIHCRQNNGGQYIDAGLVEFTKLNP
jgi:putative heme-binding domain-containing protein